MADWHAGTQVIPEQPSLDGQVLSTLPSQSTSERRSLEQCGPLHCTGVEPSPTRPPLPLPLLPPLPPSPSSPPSVVGLNPFFELEPQPAAQRSAPNAAQAPRESFDRMRGILCV